MDPLTGVHVTVSGLLALGGGLKVARPRAAARALRSLRLPMPDVAVRWAGAAEIVIAAAALVLGGGTARMMIEFEVLHLGAAPRQATGADMTLHITVSGNGGLKPTELELPPGSTVADVYQALRISRQACIAEVGGSIVPVDYPLTDHESLFLVRAMSGG